MIIQKLADIRQSSIKAVPKCQDCKSYLYFPDLGKGKKRHFCSKEQTHMEFREARTSPKWCPKREGESK